jgi:ABC-type glycerol-3-phosphate transport system substrate-binding protein
MNTPLRLLAALAACLALATGATHAAPPSVEIVAMSHPPVKMALQPLRDWLAAQGDKLKVREIDSESAEGAKRFQVAGLSGHIPVLILIDGQYKHQRKDGSTVEFVNFPNLPNTPVGARGAWITEDVQAVLTQRIKR